MKRKTKIIVAAVIVAVMLCALSVTAFAASGDVAGAIQNTWNSAKTQIKQVVNNVVFPVIDLVLAVLFFAKVALHEQKNSLLRLFKVRYGEGKLMPVQVQMNYNAAHF